MKFIKLSAKAIAPKRATEGSAGYDLYVPENTIVWNGRSVIKIGIAIQLPWNLQAEIRPRSGFSLKGFEGYDNSACEGEPMRFDADVCLGTIDEDYRESIGVIVNNHDKPFWVKAGTRIAQMVITRYEALDLEEVNELSETERKGGFGSTGTR